MLGPGHDRLIFNDQGYRDEQRTSASQSSHKNLSRGAGTAADGGDHHVSVEHDTHMSNICYRWRYCNSRLAAAR